MKDYNLYLEKKLNGVRNFFDSELNQFKKNLQFETNEMMLLLIKEARKEKEKALESAYQRFQKSMEGIEKDRESGKFPSESLDLMEENFKFMFEQSIKFIEKQWSVFIEGCKDGVKDN